MHNVFGTSYLTPVRPPLAPDCLCRAWQREAQVLYLLLSISIPFLAPKGIYFPLYLSY